ncbi:hypothetical protein [Saccharopolyspora gloriosae]|uniref:hypothetical protein n=1 Tax=Saccharopolyspora gloriosae TaxID=455344 RepID=UPI001FB79F19|nr:hypothetical protein [Saccharopolyspora gloriosae]
MSGRSVLAAARVTAGGTAGTRAPSPLTGCFGAGGISGATLVLVVVVAGFAVRVRDVLGFAAGEPVLRGAALAVEVRVVDFAEADLEVVDLAPLDFAAVDLAAVDLAAVVFAAVDLAAVDFAAVDFAAVDLVPVDFAAVDLGVVDLDVVDFAVPDLVVPVFVVPDSAAPDFAAPRFAAVPDVPDDRDPADLVGVDFAPESTSPEPSGRAAAFCLVVRLPRPDFDEF